MKKLIMILLLSAGVGSVMAAGGTPGSRTGGGGGPATRVVCLASARTAAIDGFTQAGGFQAVGELQAATTPVEKAKAHAKLMLAHDAGVSAGGNALLASDCQGLAFRMPARIATAIQAAQS